MAANTDKFRKVARRWVGQIGAGGVADDSVTTIPLASATNLPTDTAVCVVVDRVDSNGTATPTTEETIVGTVSGDNITNALRGVEGTAQAHSAGAVVEVLMTADNINDMIDGLLVQHNQLGLHTNITASNVTASGTLSGVTMQVSGQTTLSDVAACDVTVQTLSSVGDMDLADAKNITEAGVDPYKTIDLFSESWTPTTTGGCGALTKQEEGTNDIDYNYLPFDKDSDEKAFRWVWMPGNWDGGVIQFRVAWAVEGGGSAETVTWELSGRSYADDEAIDQATGTAVEVADTWTADGDINTTAWSGDVTITGATAGEMVYLRLMRDVSEHDLSDDARLIAVQIRYKESQYNHY